MALLNNYIKVKELTNNLLINDILEKYDDTSPYMFAEIIDMSQEVASLLSSKTGLEVHQLWNKSVIVVKRVTKVKGFLGYYVQVSDLIEVINRETYNKYVYNG